MLGNGRRSFWSAASVDDHGTNIGLHVEPVLECQWLRLTFVQRFAGFLFTSASGRRPRDIGGGRDGRIAVGQRRWVYSYLVFAVFFFTAVDRLGLLRVLGDGLHHAKQAP